MELVNKWYPSVKFRDFSTPFQTYPKYENQQMDEFPLTGNSLQQAEMEYNVRCVHNIRRIHHIEMIIRIKICYISFHLGTQTLAYTLPGFQCPKRCIQHLTNHLQKPILYTSNYHYLSTVIIHTWSKNQV